MLIELCILRKESYTNIYSWLVIRLLNFWSRYIYTCINTGFCFIQLVMCLTLSKAILNDS